MKNNINEKIKINNFIKSCFSDCEKWNCILLTIVCKLIVFTAFTAVITYSVGYLINTTAIAFIK